MRRRGGGVLLSRRRRAVLDRPFLGGWALSVCLSRRGGGVRVAVVDRERERASIRPSSAAKPHLLWHWISPNRHRGTRTGAVLSAQVVVRRAQRTLRYVSTSFSRRCRQRSCVFAASSSLAKTRGTSFFFVCWARGDFPPLTKSDAVPPLTLFWSRQPTAGFPANWLADKFWAAL